MEVFYPEKISPTLRDSLEQELEERYWEKYTSRLAAAETQPIMTIEYQEEANTLIGEEITAENIDEILSG
ncbi:hypothetical protein [Candidatus Nanohalobium constans]|uniref:Uncharacterized protein n=1 Tax=Candidatus Nanohalobium constans TaxID=2565781 RepID=A0A5Q0UIR5_9ARCH|nr:hypothetical protein [Candidatus Nanohalobium constans]QGA80845.1 hypothetical protein LC1Nh_0964 [Candidatus Nanohalobium constans]